MENYARDVERKKPHFAQYNILPLQVSGPPPPIMEIPGIRAAVNALSNLDQLPMAKADQTTAHVTQQPNHGNEVNQSQTGVPLLPSDKERTRSIHDLLDWLGLAFGFQVYITIKIRYNNCTNLIYYFFSTEERKCGESKRALDFAISKY